MTTLTSFNQVTPCSVNCYISNLTGQPLTLNNVIDIGYGAPNVEQMIPTSESNTMTLAIASQSFAGEVHFNTASGPVFVVKWTDVGNSSILGSFLVGQSVYRIQRKVLTSPLSGIELAISPI